MTEPRTKNSEQKLLKLEEEEAAREAEPGILEIFDRDVETPDADAPLTRDAAAR